MSRLPPLLFLLFIPLTFSHPLTVPISSLSHQHLQTPSVHGVEDIAPALTNATNSAIQRAKNILSKYSDALRIVAIPTGLGVSFSGYFLLTPVLFLAAFISGGGACFVAVNAILGDSTPAAAWISIAAMLLGGAMLGFFAMRVLSFGMFAVGAALGVILVSALKTTLIAEMYPKDPKLAFIIAAVVAGLAFGLLAMCLQKQMLIFSTAYAGSCACVFGIGHFAGHFPTTDDLSAVEAGKFNAWVVLYVGLTFCIGTAGMLFQFWLAKGKQMPEHAPHDRRRRRRRRAYDYDDWSDRDDDWTDDVYIERVPLPRRKRDGSRGRPYTRMEDTSHAREYKSSPARMRAEAPDMGGDIEKEDGGMMEENVVASVKRTEVRGTTGKGKATDVSHGVVRELRKFGTVELAESDAAEVTDAAEVVEEEVKSGLVHVSLGSDAENYLMRDMAIKV